MDADPSPRAAGRPRDPAVDDRILTAVQEQLVTSGYAGTTIESVARAAGTGKSAVYRRWPGKIELVVAAVLALNEPVETPDTGSLRQDLIQCAMHYAGGDERAAQVLASILGELRNDPELFRAAYTAIGRPPVTALVEVIGRWIARGVVPEDARVELIAGIVPTAAFGSVTLRRRSLDAEAVAELVDYVLLPALGAK
ncbi:TetR/AcrR family transcriptional regulator [Leifsonia shinshuensis]|uniref:TetR/AcrR family transcriptional regulator n=1 Tax=Leifsonia shinshuensis TaxID=150026 RepID=UPI001F50B65F|nr:TetR/AcrR family transcriptional regulator [Leifsonia shinshuensis]MCI0157681.1 TetR/AcrR family transcriptional regulator [Leifsonia shinshuensis]